MERVATVRWRTPAPTSVDEELVVYDDGSAWLVARRPATDPAAVGTFRCGVDEAERAVLAKASGAPIDIDLLHPPTEGPEAALAEAAARIATLARTRPHAIARFHGQPVPGEAGGPLTVALAVVGEGTVDVVFELDAAASAVLFSADGAPLSWVELPELQTGFVTPTAEGLGGLRRRAAVSPGQMGALTVAVTAPAGVGEAQVQVGGWLVETLPDDRERQRFEARTAPAALA